MAHLHLPNVSSTVQGMRNGEGTQYYGNGEVYTGEFSNNVRQGQGRLVYSNGDVYEGSWEGDHRNGSGCCTYASGAIFYGTFLKDKREGMGTLLRPKQVRSPRRPPAFTPVCLQGEGRVPALPDPAILHLKTCLHCDRRLRMQSDAQP